MVMVVLQIVTRGGLDVYIDGVLQSTSQLDQMVIQTLDATPDAVLVGQSAAFPCASGCPLLVALPGNINPDSVFCVDQDDQVSTAITAGDTTAARVVIRGSDGCDCIVGSAAKDVIYRLDGDDYILGMAGRDTVYGVGLDQAKKKKGMCLVGKMGVSRHGLLSLSSR